MANKALKIGGISIIDTGTLTEFVVGTTVVGVFNQSTGDFTVGSADKTPVGKLHIGEISVISHGTESSKPDSGNGILYIKSGKLIIRYNDSSSNKYQYIDLTSTSNQQWTYSATEP